MVFHHGRREQSAEEQARAAEISAYRKRNEELERASDFTAMRSFLDRPDDVQKRTRELAFEAMGNLFERIKILAELHGGTAKRLDAYPEDLPLPEGKHFHLKPERAMKRNSWISEGDEMFVRMDVKGRTYVFFIPESGNVNVYENGEYVGSNHDLALYEINTHLENGDWMGVNAG